MTIKKWFKNLFAPRQTDEDKRRSELILSILLGSSIAGFVIINLIRIVDYFIYPNTRGLPLIITLLILAGFIFLFWFAKKGWIKTASIILILIFSAPMFYSFLIWGTDLSAALLLAVLVIALSGALLGAKTAFTSTIIITSFLIVLTDLQARGIIAVKSYWRSEQAQIGDAITYTVIFFIIATVSWLFCRQIKQALRRARTSEAELRIERDSLEIKVQERTAQIREMESEKINQLYRLAEFGRLSSGIFHDLVNPLTAVALNLEQIENDGRQKIVDAKSYLSQAILATHKMEDLIASIKKQIQKENTICSFSVNEEINQIIQILAYKSRRANIEIEFLPAQDFSLRGDPIKFGQIITNLLANSLDACETKGTTQKINIKIDQKGTNLILSVSDKGCGIVPENITKIFEPFFSTKKEQGRGLGLGLASTKNITEKDFGGTIAVASRINEGTEFVITLPYETTI